MPLDLDFLDWLQSVGSDISDVLIEAFKALKDAVKKG
jgi:hypothetical protein